MYADRIRLESVFSFETNCTNDSGAVSIRAHL